MTIFLFLFLPFVSFDGPTDVLRSAKAERFASNFALDDSGYVPPTPPLLILYMLDIVISSLKKVTTDLTEFNTKYRVLRVFIRFVILKNLHL